MASLFVLRYISFEELSFAEIAAVLPLPGHLATGSEKNVGDVGDVGDLRAFCPVFTGFWLPARLAMLATLCR